MVTTTSMTTVSVSMRSAQSTLRSPDVIQEKIAPWLSWWPNPTSAKANQDSTIEANRNTVVTSSAAREPAACGCGMSGSPWDASRTACGPCGDGAARAWLSSTGPWA